jgi:hypothetical protein
MAHLPARADFSAESSPEENPSEDDSPENGSSDENKTGQGAPEG